MQINNSAQAYNINQVQNNNPNASIGTDNTTTTKTQTDTVTISNAGRNAEEKWQSIANRYDVTNMSQTEVGKMTEELHNNALIPEGVRMHMLAPASMNQDLDQKYDVLSRMRDSLDFSKSVNAAPKQIEKQTQVVDIFERLSELFSKGSQA